MKIAVIAIIALLVLGGGGAGAYFYLNKPAVASAGPEDEAAKAEHAKKVEGAEGAVAAAEEFVPLDVMVFPIIDETGVTQTITLVVSIEVPDKLAADEVKRLTPRLKDAFIQDMYGALNRKNSMKNGVLEVAAIKERLNRVSAKVLGKDKVNDVLLQIVQQRQL